MNFRSAVAKGVRNRGIAVAVAGACVAAVVAAAAGAASPPLPPDFLLSGHWVFNAGLGQAVHVNGPTGSVDARAEVPADEGSVVLQGDTSGYVVDGDESTEFDKSTLEVVGTKPLPSGETPEVLTAAGGPYLVYRRMGTIVRLGETSSVIDVGEPLGSPVATGDGTVHLHRTGSGVLCALARDAVEVSCPLAAPKGHGGALTVIEDKPVFVDTTTDTAHALGATTLEPGAPLGFDVPDAARLAANDVAGRIAVLDPDAHRVHLVDPAEPAGAVEVDLPEGDYADPVSTGAVVVLVDRSTRTLYTYDGRGKPGEVKEIPAEEGEPRVSRGEDARVYVDGDQGEHVLVVDRDGDVTDVPITPGEPGHVPSPPAETSTTPTTAADVPAREPDVRALPQVPPPAQPTTRVQPPPPPASPPGAPASAAATAGDAAATVTWGPAPDNGSAITGYLVSWAAPGGGGSTGVGGDVRSWTATGLANLVPVTFTVRAVNAAGQGTPAAANPVTPVAPRSATLTQGARVECRNEDDMPCNWMHVVMTGFEPNTSYKVIARRGQDDWKNDDEPDRVTDAGGNVAFDGFYYYGVGNTVWVEVFTPTGVVRSNSIVWS